MQRLTFEVDFCDIAQCYEERGGRFCEDGACSQRKVWERLKMWEDLGDYGLIKTLAEAEKEDRIVVFSSKGRMDDFRKETERKIYG